MPEDNSSDINILESSTPPDPQELENTGGDLLLSKAEEKKFSLDDWNKHQNINYRKYLMIWTCIVVSFYLLLVFFLVINNDTLKLHDSVLIAILGTTTANVLGLPYIILKGLFGSDNNTDKI